MQAWDSMLKSIVTERDGLWIALQYLHTYGITESQIIGALKAGVTFLAGIIILSAGILLLINGKNGKY